MLLANSIAISALSPKLFEDSLRPERPVFFRRLFSDLSRDWSDCAHFRRRARGASIHLSRKGLRKVDSRWNFEF
jgi:hypothetical protein